MAAARAFPAVPPPSPSPRQQAPRPPVLRSPGRPGDTRAGAAGAAGGSEGCEDRALPAPAASISTGKRGPPALPEGKGVSPHLSGARALRQVLWLPRAGTAWRLGPAQGRGGLRGEIWGRLCVVGQDWGGCGATSV